MSVRILVNKQAESFVINRAYRDSTGPSDDGMRRGFSYTVHVTFSFSFENEKHENDAWSYDLSVIKKTDGGYCDRDSNILKTPADLEKNFSFISIELRNRGISILNTPAYMLVKCEFYERYPSWRIGETRSDENTVELKFDGEVYPIEKDTNIITASDLIAHVSEQDEEKKWVMIAQAIGDKTLFNGSYCVPLSSIPDEFYGRTKLVRLNKITVDGLIETGIASEADIEQALKGFVSRVKKEYCIINTQGIERFIVNLPDEMKKTVLEHCWQTSNNLQLFRDFYPTRITWSNVAAEDYLDSDLDLMIQGEVYANGPKQWEFIDRCMEKPALEKKIVENACVLGRHDISRIVDHLRKCTTADLFRSVIKYAIENPHQLGLHELSNVFDLDYTGTGLVRSDYDNYLKVAARYSSNRAIAFALKVGLLAGVSETELVEMLLDQKTAHSYIELYEEAFNKVYEQFNFAPGLAWVKVEEERRKAEKQRIAKERADSNKKVIKFVQDSEKLAIRVTIKRAYSSAGEYEVYRPDGEHVGNLQPDENRVILVEGKTNYYLVNVERVKKLRNGVFHFDVLEEDAGYVIGSKGCHIKEITEKLNQLGCQLRTIKVHTHDEQ